MSSPRRGSPWVASLREEERLAPRFGWTCGALFAGTIAAALLAVVSGPARPLFAVVALLLCTALAVIFPVGSLRTGRTLGLSEFPFVSTDIYPCRRRTPVYFAFSLVFWTLFFLFVWMLAIRFTLRVFH